MWNLNLPVEPGDKDMERPEGKTTRIRCRKSGTSAKPSYREYEQV
jgi:hypothetical protein